MLSKQLIVYPTSRAIREYINSQREFNTLLPHIITIGEFFKKFILFENKKIIDEEERFLLLKQAVRNVDIKKLGISSTFSHFIKQSDYIYRFFLELASENVDIETLSTKDTYGFYSEHLDILKQIRENYLELLDKNQAIDRINMALYFKVNMDFLKRYENVEIFFEGYFTSFEFEIIKEVSQITKLNINFIYNNFNKKSIEKFIDFGIDLDEGYSYKIDFSQKNILEKNILKSSYDNITIKGFSSRINQIAFIKKSITQMIEQGLNPSKIALILPDETFTSSIALFDYEGYFNYAMGLNIYTSSTYKIVDGIFSYISDDEIKNIENIKYLALDIEEINSLFKANYKKVLTQTIFEQIVEFIISKEKNKELIEKLKELFYKLYKLFFTLDEKILVKDALKLLHQKIASLSLDDVNSGKITVMGLLESRSICFDGVIICDFNESLIPKRSLKDKFLSTQLKKSVNLPTSIDRENLQKYYYERLISTSKKVYISYVKNDSEHISRFANSLFKKNIDENLYDNAYKHILYKNSKIEHFSDEIILDIDLSKRTWSATSLKNFLECKRKYYLNNILKIKEHEISLKPKAYELGNLVHETLEEYYKQNNRTYEKLIDIFTRKRVLNPFLNLDMEIWKRKFQEFIEIENARFEKGFKVLKTEEPFLIDFEGIKLQGSIDRIDSLDDEFYVLDYKTSSNLKVNSKRNYEKAVDFQLEFYYLAVENMFKTDKIKTFYYDLHNLKLLEEVVLDEKLKLLSDIFKEFKTFQVNFSKCENSQTCQYCTYKTLCNK